MQPETRTPQDAANHFLELYAEEIRAWEVTPDTIHEWWTMTKDQYPDVELPEVEHLIRF